MSERPGRMRGMGMSYLYTDLDVDVSESGFSGNLSFGGNAVLLYATLKF